MSRDRMSGAVLAARPGLARLTVPILIVWATADTFFELSWAYWLRDLIPGATGWSRSTAPGCSS
jgi:pimeloyl-ACP methyl ester carboxylesterase